MAGECGIILKVVDSVKGCLFDTMKDYVSYIGSYNKHLGSLHQSLSDLCDVNNDFIKELNLGKDDNQEITNKAKSWLEDIRGLANDEVLKGLMYKDFETAKFVVKLMGKKELKERLCKESEMSELVVEVMKKLKDDMENSDREETRKMARVDYLKVAEVMADVMKDSIEEFKKFVKHDKKVAVIAVRMLKERDLEKLLEDEEMKKIVEEVGNYASDDEEVRPNDEDKNSSTLLVKAPKVGIDENSVKEAAVKVLTPLMNLLKPLDKLMKDAKFNKAVPQAHGVKLGLEVILGLLMMTGGSKKEMDGNNKQQRRCCCTVSLCDYHGRYHTSKDAESIANHIKDDIISKCPPNITSRIRRSDLNSIRTQFVKGLSSRDALLRQILEHLEDDQVYVVGIFGMGGTGKTTLAKEVNNKVKDMFGLKVMVEVTEAPDIVRIQEAIAESIGLLSLHEVNTVAERAVRLYNRLEKEKEKKILVILDNIWEKLNLEEIGIPRTCKLILTTRERRVCEDMGVRDVNIREVGVMDTNESKELFRTLAINQADVEGYENVVDRLLNKCGGLPLAIVATANSLKDKELSSWEKFADELKKPFSSQVSSAYRNVYSILITSYKFIEVANKRMFFLLACLSPPGSSILVENLMRYGIALRLFQNVNKLCEAMDLAKTWTSELVSSSMLLDDEGEVKIHDIVRHFAISFAAKEEKHEFMVETIPRWLEDESFENYTAMSLISRNDYSRLDGVQANKLQILILRGDMSPNFSDSFFKGMMNLEVLDLSKMNFHPGLPNSMWQLKKLRTLCMESCNLGDIKQICELVNLLVLSLRKSFLEKLPNEIGKLSKLRLLDLTGCMGNQPTLIPPGVLGRLSRLEGLYLFNEDQVVYEMKSADGASATEKIELPYLNALEITVPRIEHLLVDFQSAHNLDNYKIAVGNADRVSDSEYSRRLSITDMDDVIGVVEKSCLKALLKRVNYLNMFECSNFEHLVPALDQEGFKDLIYLKIDSCDDFECLVKGRGLNNFIVFPRLLVLWLKSMPSLKMVCDGEVLPGMFSNLQFLELDYLDQLQYLLPLGLIPTTLQYINVQFCKLLKFLFIEDEETRVIELPDLVSLSLSNLASLMSLVGPKRGSDTCGDVRECQFLFNGKIRLPSLEKLRLTSCDNVVNLWSKGFHTFGFHNLKEIHIYYCNQLLSVGSPSTFSVLAQLETLSISKCRMREVITHTESEELESVEQTLIFPQMKSLVLDELWNLESFYAGEAKLEFPNLKMLSLCDLGSMKRFAKFENSSALFHEKIKFPCLESLSVINVTDEVVELWDWQSSSVERGSVTSNPAPMLKRLTIGSKTGLRRIPPVILDNLSSLTLVDFENKEFMFSASDLTAGKGLLCTYSQQPKLEELIVRNSSSLKELLEENCNGADDALTLFCGQLKTLKLISLPNLNHMPLHLFKGLVSLTLSGLKWNYVISGSALGESLQHLETLYIGKCELMVAFVVTDNLIIQFPQLKALMLSELDSLKSFSSAPKEATLRLPSLITIRIHDCGKLEHFWSGSIVAPKLENLFLRCCQNMRYIFKGNPEHPIELRSLRKVEISYCNSIKSFSSAPLTATPILKRAYLYDCESMHCFLWVIPNKDGDLLFPSLEKVKIINCPNMHFFSLTSPLTSKLTQMCYDDQKYSMLPYKHLNHFLQNMTFDYGEDLNRIFGEGDRPEPIPGVPTE